MCETDYLSTNNNDVLTSATIAYHHFLIIMYISDVKVCRFSIDTVSVIYKKRKLFHF